MKDAEDFATYGQPNDIAPEDPAPREPRGQPDLTNESFQIWLFDAEDSETVPDTYVVSRNPEPLDFRMWVFVGSGPNARFVMRASHRYAPEAAESNSAHDCCEVLLEGKSLTEDHCPETVEALVERLTNATVTYPEKSTDEGQGSPINY